MMKVYHEKLCYNIFMKKIVYIVILFCAVPIYFLHAQSFSRSLSIGSTGEDVRALQVLLNKDIVTQVNFTGIGSPGLETDYFGELTKQAVIKFQNKYANAILYPVGLSQGTGYVGPSTINFLNTLEGQQPTAQTSGNYVTPSTNSVQQPADDAQFFVSKKAIRAGEQISVGGYTNLKELSFYLNDELLPSECFTEFTCQLDIDKKTNPGTYKLKTSNPALGGYTLTILDSSSKKPEIKIKSLSLTQENELKGENLSPTIRIYTMYGVFKSETKDDSFILEFPKESTLPPLTEGLFFIENDDGLTSDILTIPYEI